MPHTILIIDDDPNFTPMLQMSLEAEGYTVVSARNPIIGWEEMERSKPDILLVDWVMPEMDGIEFIKLLKDNAEHRTRYIIMITGRGGTENIVAALDAGADDYLIKPFQIEELMARVRSGLRIRSLEQRIVDEAKRLTVFEMALSVADKVGNPVAAAKLYQQMLLENSQLTPFTDILDSLKSLGSLLDEALNLINQYQTIKTPRSIPAPGGKTMIAPE
jgi:sigma-B regulation protein RsbU (phosphoserine phosphatase)